MSMTHEEMDQVVNDHFMFEAADDIDGVMSSFTDNGVVHEAVPSPVGPLDDRAEIRAYYKMLFPYLSGGSVKPIRRLYGDDFLVDETLWTGEITDGHWCLCEGKSGPVSFRLLHVFELRDGKISSEQVWVDLAAIQQQLGCTVS
jgi:ketosteroid isomerase-like protein